MRRAMYLIEREIDGKRFSRDEERFYAWTYEDAQQIAELIFGECEVFECFPEDDIPVTEDQMLDLMLEYGKTE